MVADLATTPPEEFDSPATKSFVRLEIANLRTVMVAGFGALREEMFVGHAALREEMKAGDAALREELKAGDAALRHEMTVLQSSIIKWFIGTYLATISVLVPIVALLQL
ncbi:MAG: hypothetical protein ACKO8P_05550 [Actinomycetota bacterium]